MSNLFEKDLSRPLADILRPDNINDVVGQDHLLGEKGAIKRMLLSKKLNSFILWGPPGCGKTTIARLIADEVGFEFQLLSAVFSGVADLRKVFKQAKEKRSVGKQTLLFVDEIHRFNKAQQDGFLPYVEDGTIILVGATTENPSFELNAALLSRCQVYVLNRLDERALEELLLRAEKTYEKELPINEEARHYIKSVSDGDGRFLLTAAETIFNANLPKTPDGGFGIDVIKEIIHKRAPIYDKKNDGHYNLISAVHKSLRGSDVNAALYWVSRMLDAGEDPKYILRRLTRFAVEDVSLADPNAVSQAISCWQTYERIGSPEGDLAISQLVAYLATAPKSASLYKAHKLARKTAQETGSLMPPKHILNAPTKLMEDLGYSRGYVYDQDEQDGFSGQDYFPEEMGRRTFYKPVNRGFEREISKRIAYWDRLRKEKQDEKK